MISVFLTSVTAPSGRHASISRNALRWLLISTIFYPAFLAAKFDKRTNRVSTDVADKHAQASISEIAT